MINKKNLLSFNIPTIHKVISYINMKNLRDQQKMEKLIMLSYVDFAWEDAIYNYGYLMIEKLKISIFNLASADNNLETIELFLKNYKSDKPLIDHKNISFACYIKEYKTLKMILKYPIIKKLHYKKEQNVLFWHHFIINKSHDQKLWHDLANDDDNYFLLDWHKKNNSGDMVWHLAMHKLYYNNDFWNSLSNNNRFFVYWEKKDWKGRTLWHYAANLIKSNTFWENIIKDGILAPCWNDKDKDGLSFWHGAIRNIKSNKFWESVAKINNNCNILYKEEKNCNHNFNFWRDAIQNIKSELFWELSSKNRQNFIGWEKDLNMWSYTNLWDFAIDTIKSELFWKNIIQYSEITEDWKKKITKRGSHEQTIWDKFKNKFKILYMRMYFEKIPIAHPTKKSEPVN
jgi:hypothetical protein